MAEDLGQDEGTPFTDSAALLWDEARRQNAAQVAEVDLLRTRAVAVLSVASLVAGLFGGRIVAKSPHPHYVGAAIGVALVAFALSVLAIVVVLKPQKMKWEFAQNLTSYFEDLAAGEPIQPVDVTFNLAKDFEASRIQNKVVLGDWCETSGRCG